MTNYEFIDKLKDILNKRKTVYLWGGFGAPITENIISILKKMYPSFYTSARLRDLRYKIGKDYFGFDCVGLIKGVLWGWNGNESKTYGGAVYASNGVPDVTSEGMIALCKNVTSDFSVIEPGEAVWMQGHIGVYIGDGKVIESSTKWANSVQLTACKNVKTISGLNSRVWTKHGKLPWIEYQKKTSGGGTSDEKTYTVKKGDTLSSIAAKYGTTYQKIADLNGIKDPNKISVGKVLKIPASTKIKVGDKVKIKSGAPIYGSTRKLNADAYKTSYTVTEVAGKRAVINKGKTVIAAMNTDNLIKL